jgi:hypothetical protein
MQRQKRSLVLSPEQWHLQEVKLVPVGLGEECISFDIVD